MPESEKLNPFLALAGAFVNNSLMPQQQRSKSRSKSRSRSRARKDPVSPSGWDEYNTNIKNIVSELNQDIGQLNQIAENSPVKFDMTQGRYLKMVTE
jgi:hypothetical protein